MKLNWPSGVRNPTQYQEYIQARTTARIMRAVHALSHRCYAIFTRWGWRSAANLSFAIGSEMFTQGFELFEKAERHLKNAYR